jgi:hypothetical protein
MVEQDKPVVKGPIDGNAFAVMGAVKRALREAGRGDLVEEYITKAISGDYDNLLAVSQEYVDFDFDDGYDESTNPSNGWRAPERE